VRSLGADVIVDYKTTPCDHVVRDQDMVFDTQGGDTLLRSFACVKPGGVVVTVGGVPDAKFARAWGLSLPIQWALAFMTRKITRLARQRLVRFEYWFMKPSGEQLAAIAGLVENGIIRPVVARMCRGPGAGLATLSGDGVSMPRPIALFLAAFLGFHGLDLCQCLSSGGHCATRTEASRAKCAAPIESHCHGGGHGTAVSEGNRCCCSGLATVITAAEPRVLLTSLAPMAGESNGIASPLPDAASAPSVVRCSRLPPQGAAPLPLRI
jgi:hypothetical protein